MAAAAAATALQVASLSFCRLECDHAELFLAEYKRSNRTKGLKILRCFPHCCPNHIDRSYCGSSLHVIVQTDGVVPRGSDTTGVSLVARFECSTDAGLRVGDTLAASDVTRETQSEDNPEGQWIPGIKERASTLSSAMASIAQTITPRTLVYQLNGKVYSRWYYDWESGANKAQRLMRHVLKAYVLERNGDTMRVIGVVSSPEFTVISYRRAQNEGGGNGGLSSSVEMTKATSHHRISPTNSNDQDDMHRRIDKLKRPTASVSSDAESDAKRRRRGSAGPHRRALSLSNASPAELFEDRVLWEYAHAPVVTLTKNLALVYWFLKWTPLESYGSFVDELVHLLNYQVLEPIVRLTATTSSSTSTSSPRVDKLNCFARVLLESTTHATRAPHFPQVPPPHRHATPAVVPASPDLLALLRVIAQAALWFVSDEMRAWFRAFFARHASAVTDKQRLRLVFVEFVNEIVALLTQRVFAHTPLHSLAIVAEEIIAAVYTHELYHPKRPLVRQILGEHGFIGWRPFVAQMRDAYIATHHRRRHQHPPTAPPSRPPVAIQHRHAMFERAWNGDWRLDLNESAWKQNESAVDTSIALVSVLDTVVQVTSLRVTLDVDARTLGIRSHASVLVPTGGALSLVLDGTSRVFRFFPHGWSAGLGDGALGDYVGSIRMDTPERLVVYLETFHWPRQPGERAYHTRLRIECWKHERLFVNGEILTSTLATAFPEEERQFLGELQLAAKLKAVAKFHDRVHAQRLLQQPGAVPKRSSPWQRLANFRLSYNRIVAP